jgi:hypothetical protein
VTAIAVASDFELADGLGRNAAQVMAFATDARRSKIALAHGIIS